MNKKHYVITSRPVKKVSTGNNQPDQFWYPAHKNAKNEQAVNELHCGVYTEHDNGYVRMPWFYDPGPEQYDYSPAATWQSRFQPRGGSEQMLNALFSELDALNKDVLVFMHGYGNDTPKELQHLELLHLDYVKPEGSAIGRILMVSWPSKGVFKYNSQGAAPNIFEQLFKGHKPVLDIINDTSNFAPTGDVFAAFLLKLKAFLGMRYGANPRPKMHLVVQSMANQVLARTAWRLEQYAPIGTLNCLFENLILTSPDLPQNFLDKFDPLKRSLAFAEKSWITFSEQDKTLRLSGNIDADNTQERLGFSGPLNGTKDLPLNTTLINIEQGPTYHRLTPPDYHHRLFEYNSEVINFYRNIFSGAVQTPVEQRLNIPANTEHPGVEEFLYPGEIV